MTQDLEARLHIGPAGWQYEDWNGVVYPSPRPRGFNALEFIASYFNLDEINSTFYRVPAPEMSRRWAERVANRPGFLFTAKAHQSLTHGPGPSRADADLFVSGVAPLLHAGRLGAVLLQFPWSFRFDASARRRIDFLLDALAPLPLAVEVRHGSWQSADADAYLAAANVTVCGIDQPVIRESVEPYRHRPGPAGAYFRFHGRNYRAWFNQSAGRDERYNYLYTTQELSPWAAVIREAAAGSARVFVVLNNHFRGQAPANALELAGMLLDRRLPAPESLRSAYPALARWTVAEPGPSTGDLFGG